MCHGTFKYYFLEFTVILESSRLRVAVSLRPDLPRDLPLTMAPLDLLDNQSWTDDKDFPNVLLLADCCFYMWPLDAARFLIMAAIWLLGGSLEAVWYSNELAILRNLEIFRLLRTIWLSSTLSNGIFTFFLYYVKLKAKS